MMSMEKCEQYKHTPSLPQIDAGAVIYFFAAMEKTMDLSVEKARVFDWPLQPITLESLMIDELLLTPYSYEQALVHYVENADGNILQHRLGSIEEYAARTAGKARSEYTIKIEGMERITKLLWQRMSDFVKWGWPEAVPFSCHAFIAEQGSPSFGDHTDPDGVAIYVISGKKTMIVEGRPLTLHPGQVLWMPHGVVHRATNEFSSVMLSIGIERYHMEKLYE